MFPLFEAEFGELTSATKIRHRRPVEDYLKLQGRFAHLFSPTRNDAVIAEIQARVDAYWDAVE